MLFLISRAGYLFIYDIPTCSKLFRNRISTDLIFTCAKNENTDGLIYINRKGSVNTINID